VSLVIRALIGFALAAAGLTFLTYGIAQAIEVGSCGTDEYGNAVGPPCPPGIGPMIVLMVLGTFVALIGAAIAGRLLRFIPVIMVAALAGVVLGIVDLHDDDTRPGNEIVVAVVAPMLIFMLPGLGKRRTRPVFTPTMPPPPQPQPQPTTNANAEDVASRLRQLDQLKEAGLLDDAAYDEQRRRILAEL
jgi:amino acid transporter